MDELAGEELSVLLHKADQTARRLVRKLGLSRADLDDVRQDLLVDLLARLPAFNPDRGTLGAFVGTVLTHRAATFARAISQERRLYGKSPLALQEGNDNGSERYEDTIAERDGLAAFLGQPFDAFEVTERRMDVERCLQHLSEEEARLSKSLLELEIGTLVRSGLGAKATLYRRMRSIRGSLSALGLGETISRKRK